MLHKNINSTTFKHAKFYLRKKITLNELNVFLFVILCDCIRTPSSKEREEQTILVSIFVSTVTFIVLCHKTETEDVYRLKYWRVNKTVVYYTTNMKTQRDFLAKQPSLTNFKLIECHTDSSLHIKFSS